MSSSYEAQSEALRVMKHTGLAEYRRPTRQPSASFRTLGFDPQFMKALQTAFPNVKRATAVQEKLIPEILGGRDILLKDDTGSGKYVPLATRNWVPSVRVRRCVLTELLSAVAAVLGRSGWYWGS
ncbi:hypothetical protein NLJ89_g1871 [Agrocybe chaxingu]|uniref:Uncharacterized protein n=1 Tax=Agrocybe chaxingu TaxID=84603 RepID=A0A9W8TEG7_9AGAR|nr:hypothetical protein NLJ89_g1871 [Agrocybe chaxingu]